MQGNASNKSLAQSSDREPAVISPAVASWLLSNAETVLSAVSAPLLFTAVQHGMHEAAPVIQATLAVQLLALNEKLYMLTDAEANKRRLRIPLAQLMGAVIPPLLQQHPDIFITYDHTRD